MEDVLKIFKLLSDETRFRIINLLNENDLCVCQITGILDIPQPKVSKALSKMKDLNIVTDKREDKYVYYSLNNNDLIKYIIDYMKLNNHNILEKDIENIKKANKILKNCRGFNDSTKISK